jgi:tRNA (guanine37-N1)-methyltransferase
MRIDVVTLFPELVDHAARFGVTGRALERGLWQLATWNPRDFATDNYRTVDDRPYGGGPGMVMLAEPLAKAVARRGRRSGAGYGCRRRSHDAGRRTVDAPAGRGVRSGGGCDGVR